MKTNTHNMDKSIEDVDHGAHAESLLLQILWQELNTCPNCGCSASLSFGSVDTDRSHETTDSDAHLESTSVSVDGCEVCSAIVSCVINNG